MRSWAEAARAMISRNLFETTTWALAVAAVVLAEIMTEAGVEVAIAILVMRYLLSVWRTERRERLAGDRRRAAEDGLAVAAAQMLADVRRIDHVALPAELRGRPLSTIDLAVWLQDVRDPFDSLHRGEGWMSMRDAFDAALTAFSAAAAVHAAAAGDRARRAVDRVRRAAHAVRADADQLARVWLSVENTFREEPRTGLGPLAFKAGTESSAAPLERIPVSWSELVLGCGELLGAGVSLEDRANLERLRSSTRT